MSDVPLPAAAQRVHAALSAAGLSVTIRVTQESARTAKEAADALGVSVAQIAKSLIFRTREKGLAVLVIAAGDNRVDEKKVAAMIGEKIERADATFVREATGFAIGGVPPVIDNPELIILCDETLARFDTVWAAAGTPHAVFPVSPLDLFRISGGRIADVRVA